MSGQLIGRGYITIAGLKDGDPAKTYVLLPSVESVTKKLDGTLSVKTVNCSVYKVTGSSAYALTSDHTVTFVRKPDGQTGTLAHPSGATGNVNILAATESVEFELKDGSTVIDRVRVPVLSDATDVNNELDTYNYLKEALEKQGTTMKPGLMLTSFIAVGYTDDSNVRHTQAGMNGIYVPTLGGRTPAAWYGGPMVDRFNADGTVNNSLAAGSYATSLIRMDGSAYFANGNIRFKNDGTAEFGDTANGYGITLGSNGRLTLGNGIDINIGGEAQGLSASISSVTNLANELSNLFTPFNGNTEETWKRIIEGKATYDNVRVNAGFWTESFVSVKGKNPDGGTSGSGTGSGGAYGLVRTWQEASAEGSDTNSALGANLGYSLYSALTSHTADTTAHITAAERTKWNKVVTDFAAITGSDSDSVINKWEEVVNFLATYTEADTLANLLGNKADKTQLTNGSVTKVGTASVGGSSRPIYLNGGTPTACGYTFGNASGNAAVNNGTLNTNLNADMWDGQQFADYRMRKHYTLNLESLPETNFYPVTFDPNDFSLDCEIHSPNRVGNHAYNQNFIHFEMVERGWSDTPKMFRVITQGNYADAEITVGAIGGGTRGGVKCVWLRGGCQYRILSNSAPTLRASDYTYDNEKFTVGPNLDGGTNANVNIVWRNNSDRRKSQLATFSDNVASATKLSDNTAFKAWGQTFFENGKPKAVTGALSSVTTITASGAVTAASFKKTGGTSSQFLKADGSVDGTAYLPKSTFDSMFELVTENGVTSIRAKYGLWTNEFLSCKGNNPNGGTGGSGTGGGSAYGLYTDSTWESAALATDALGAQLGKYLKERIDNTYPKWQVDAKTFLADAGDGRTLTFALSKDGLATTDWLAAWCGNELRAISPAVVRSLMSVYTKAEVDAKNYLKDSGDGKTVKLAYSKAQLSTASWIAAWTVDGDAYELRAIAPATLRTLMDVYSKTETDGRISSALGGYATQSWVTSNFNKYSLPTASATVKGGVKVGSGLTIASETLAVSLSASHIPSLPWSKITTGKPTTLAGYGITDAKIANGVITLGGNTITPITSHQSLAAYLSKNEASNTYISKDGGDSYHVIMSNGNKTRKTLEYSELLTGGAVDLTNLQPNTLEPLVTRETLTGWDGSYVIGANVRESALAYCTHGAFGDIVTHNAGEFLTSANISNLLKIDGSNGTSAGVSALINKLGVGTMTPTDSDYYVTQFAGGGTTTTTYHRRAHSVLWTYIKGKANGVYQPKGSYLTAITKAQVEGVLTGNITSHTHSQYLTSHQSLADYVTLGTAQTIAGVKKFNANAIISSGVELQFPTSSARHVANRCSIHGGADGAGETDANLRFGSWYGIGWYPTIKDQPVAQGNNAMWLNVRNGNLTVAGKFIKKNGTSSQFLKADGSVDSNSYLLSSAYTAADVLTKLKTVDGSGSGLDADLLDGRHAGIANDNVTLMVPFPSFSQLISAGYLRSDYASAGHPNSDFFKAILCWAIATYPAGGTLVGKAIPNAQGTCIINLYASTPDPDTKLPRYGSGIFITAVGDVQPFRVYNYDYTYSGRFQGLSDTATKLAAARSLWGRTFDGSADVSGDMTGVGSISASGQIKTTSTNAFRAAYGNYGFIIRNDGANAYFLLTNSGDRDGNWNSLRPFYIDLATGKTHMNNGTAINGGLTVGGGITTNKLNINAASSTAYQTADTSRNAFLAINGRTLMTWDESGGAVRAGSSYNNTFSLGTSAVRWSNVYATAINVSSNALVSNLNADMVDGVHAADIDHRRQLFIKADFEHYVVLLWKVNENERHRISGRLYTSNKGASRYNAADIDLWYSRWGTGNSFDKYFRLDTYGSTSPNAWKLVTCTYNGESWYALQYKATQSIVAFFIGTFDSIAFTAVKYYTSNTSTVNNSEINGSIADKTSELSRTHVGTSPYALTSDNVASATKLQTSRTLWGQSFNGGANVSGNMTGVGSIASTHGIAHNITDINTSVGTNAYWYGLGLHLGGQNNFVTLGGYFGLKLFTASGMVTMLDNGNVGIGVNPLYKLHVYGRTVIDNVDDYYALWLNKGGVCCEGGSGSVWNNGYGALNVGCYANTNQTPLIVAYRNGSAAAHTGANRLFAMELLNSGKQLNFGFGGAALMSMFSDGTFYAKTGIWTDGYTSCKGQETSSDARLKDILGEFSIDLRTIAEAPSVNFAWKDGSGEDVGSIAQYWQKVSPYLAHERRDGMLGLQYGKAALLSVVAVAKKTLSLEERVTELERENTGLRSRIAELERR